MHLEAGVYEMISAGLCVAYILVRNDMIYFMIYLLTAIGLSPGGSTHLHTNNT